MKFFTQILTENRCYKAGKTITPRGVMVHSTGANNPQLRRYVPGNDTIGWNSGGNDWNQDNGGICVHGFIGKLADGSVGVVQTMPWNYRCGHCGSGYRGSANNTHIAFEICEDGLDDAEYFAGVYHAAVELTADLCKQYGLDPQADGVVICHSEGHDRGIASNHADVMHWFPRFGKNMDTFRADVAREMEGDEMFTYEQFKAYMTKYNQEVASQPMDSWAAPYVKEAVENGMFSGVEDENGDVTIQSPKSGMTRQEAATFGVAILKAASKL